MKKTALLLGFILITWTVFAQTVEKHVISVKHITQSTPQSSGPVDFSKTMDKVNVVYAQITEEGDTLLIVNLPEVDINLMNHYFEITETASGRRLVRNVRKVYPYAKEAGLKLQEYDKLLAAAPNDKTRRQMMKEAEDQITSQYTAELKELTFSQGLILIRLIDRETGNTSYNLVKELRGKLRAFFYQGFAKLWGYNLKSEYDPQHNDEDDKIETIVTLLEMGSI